MHELSLYCIWKGVFLIANSLVPCLKGQGNWNNGEKGNRIVNTLLSELGLVISFTFEVKMKWHL